MQIESVNFKVISNDSDTYLLHFSLSDDQNQPPIFQILSDAVHFRVGEIVKRNSLKTVGVSSKFDFFDLSKNSNGYVEMDLIHSSPSVTSFEA